MKHGLCPMDMDFIDMQIATQIVHLDENGMYKDNKREVCFQTGRNKNVQVVGRNPKGQYGLDFSRMTGPESLWKNNDVIGVRASWRKGYEEILRYILENRI